MADLEQETKAAFAQNVANLMTDPLTVEDARDLLVGIAKQAGHYKQAALEALKGVAERADTDGDGMVSAEELKQAILSM
ncbi:hypothetical protein [Kitasatospora sp. NPDC056731]|uniref:hypothetical protein n=1 Tax=Kitasatospora sp. NPDC056731 TaxID=3155422 RepID=UPI003443F87E